MLACWYAVLETTFCCRTVGFLFLFSFFFFFHPCVVRLTKYERFYGPSIPVIRN